MYLYSLYCFLLEMIPFDQHKRDVDASDEPYFFFCF